MDKKIKISVIIPFYNAEKYLAKCLESVVSQTLKEIEIILIDDCSLDNSGNIANEFAQKDERIEPIANSKNQGQGFSRNMGVKISKGEYIAFVDSDDWLELQMFENLYKKAKETDSDIIKGQFYQIFDEKNEKYAYKYLVEFDKVYKYSDNPLNLLGNIVSTVWGGIYKKEFLQEKGLKFNSTRQAEDTLFHWQSFIEAKKIIFDENYYYNYNKGNENSDTRKIKKYYSFVLENLESIKAFIFEKGLQKELANAYILKCFIFYTFMLKPALNPFVIKKTHKKMLELIKDFNQNDLEEIFNQKLAPRNALRAFLSGKDNKIIRTIALLKRYFV